MGKKKERSKKGFKDSQDEFHVLKTAVDHSPVAISITRRNGEHLYHNSRFEEMFGYRVDELSPKAFESMFLSPDIYREIIEILENRQTWSGEVEMINRDGRRIPVILQAESVQDKVGESATFIGTYTDITEQRAKKEVIRYQTEYLSTLHSISLGMFRRLDLTDLLKAVIVRACRITGIPNGFLHLYDSEKNKLIMKAACGNLTDSVGYEVDLGSGLGGVIFETGDPMIIDNYQLWSKGLKDAMFKKIFSIVGIPLISGSKIEGIIGLCHHEKGIEISKDTIPILEEFSAIAQIAIDNAKLFKKQKEELERRIELEKEQKEMELKLHQSQRMESIGTLAGGIAHDFNNILSSIMGFVQIAMAEVPEETELADDLNEIYHASLRARDLIQQILTFARQSEEPVNPLRISIIMKEVLKFIRSSIPSTIKIRQNIQSDLKVLADPTQIYQIFLNLFTNAAQAMEEQGGELNVELMDVEIDLDDGSVDPGDYIKAVVSDTGVGIKKRIIQKIFDPYFTTKGVGEGTGLGLAVVHGAVKKMGGEILVKSKPGKGTTFTIYMPIADDKTFGTSGIDEKTEIPGGNGEYILVVDDEEPITKIQKRLLERLNYKVCAYNDSEEALERFKSDPNLFSVVITDMTMPNLPGDKLINAIRKIRPGIPAVLCTGFQQYLTEEALLEKGIKYFCRKPILNEDLANTVRAALNGIDKKA